MHTVMAQFSTLGSVPCQTVDTATAAYYARFRSQFPHCHVCYEDRPIGLLWPRPATHAGFHQLFERLMRRLTTSGPLASARVGGYSP